MAEEQSVGIDLENLGLTLSRPGDVLEEGHFVRLDNMTARRSGFIETRAGSVKVDVTAIPTSPASVHSLARMIVSGTGINYQGAGTEIFRNFTSISSGHSGDAVVFEDFKIDLSLIPHMIAFEATKKIKDDGTTTTGFGIAPGPVATAVADAEQNVIIDDFDNFTNYTNVEMALEDDGVIKKEGANSMKMTVEALARGTATRTIALDLGQFVIPDDSDDFDFIHFWLRVDQPKNLKEVRVMFDVDPVTNDFTQNYYWKGIEADLFTPVIDFVTTAKEGRDDGLRDSALDQAFEDDEFDSSFDFEEITRGEQQWTEFYITKNQFQRVGSDPNDWSNVAAIRIVVEANECGPVVVHIDDGKMVGGVAYRLFGNEEFGSGYDWRYVYRNSSTGSISPLSPTDDPLTVERTRADVTITFSTDLQVDKIDIYRRGGELAAQWLFSDTIPNNTGGGTVSFFDGLQDGDLGSIIETSQIEVPATATVVAIHQNRAWLDDSANPDRLWYSRKLKIEEFESSGFIVASQGGDRVRRPFALNDQLYVFTDRSIERIVGTAPSQFQPLATGAQRGLFAKYAITHGASVIFFRAYDGIYAFGGSGRAEKLTEQIDPLFEGFAVEGFNAIDGTQSDSERLGFFDNRLFYAYTDTGATRREMVYDLLAQRWEPSDRPSTSFLLLDDLGEFQSGRADGFVMQRETGNQDDGTNITFEARTKFYDFGAKQQEKNYTELIVDADTAGQDVTITAHFDNDNTSAVLGTLNTSGRTQVHFPINNGEGTFARNMAIGITGDNGNVRMRFYKVVPNFWIEPRTQLKTITDWADYGTPKRKHLRQLQLEMDTGSTTADVRVFCDGSSTPVETFLAVSTTGRQRKILSLPFDTTCKVARISVNSTSATVPVKVYTHTFDWLDDSLEATTRMQTPWDDIGVSTEKFFNELVLEIDTNSQDVTVTPEVDLVNQPAFTVNTAGQKRLYLSFPKDTKGSLIRLLISADTSTEFIYYNHAYEVLPEPRPGGGTSGDNSQTEWSSMGWAADKRLRQLVLEIDTFGNPLDVNVEIDGVISETISVTTTTGRELLILSLAADTIGKICRLTFNSPGSNDFLYYTHDFEFLKDPLDATRWDTYELDFGYSRWKYIRRLWIAAQGASAITLDVFIDEASPASFTTGFTLNPSSGWSRLEITFPPALKGQLFRFVFTSSTAFKLWLEESDVEWHPLAGERGYERARLVSPRAA
jgi:hypothetical protein